jgi:glycosyltransferase involved in cell wall biosynthesis
MSQPTRFILVGINYAPEPTGNAPYTTDLSIGLAKVGSTRVITGIPHYPWWKKQADFDDSLTLKGRPNLSLKRVNHLVPSKQGNFSRFVMELSFGLNIAIKEKLRGDVIVLVSPALISSAVVFLKTRLTRNNAKTVLWVQDLYEQGLKETATGGKLSSLVIGRIENWLLRSVDQVVYAHTAFEQAKHGLRRSGQAAGSIPNWSQFAFEPDEESDETRKRYSLSSDRLVLHIGNMGLKQGLENVIDAAREAERQMQPIHFLLVGSGNQIDNLKVLAGKCQNISFIPPVSEKELSNLLNAGDILLVNEKPGVKEMSMPSKLTTYFQTGVPVLVCSEADSIAAREIRDHNIGFWVQSGTPNDLLKAVLDLDLGNTNSVATAAKRFAEMNLGKSQAVEKFVSLLERVREQGRKDA